MTDRLSISSLYALCTRNLIIKFNALYTLLYITSGQLFFYKFENEFRPFTF